MPHGGQEHQGRHTHGHQGIHRLAEHHRRRDAQGQVPDNAAAAGGTHAQDHHAEGIQLALEPGQSAGGGKTAVPMISNIKSTVSVMKIVLFPHNATAL